MISILDFECNGFLFLVGGDFTGEVPANCIDLVWSSVKHHTKMNNTLYTFLNIKILLMKGIEQMDAIM